MTQIVRYLSRPNYEARDFQGRFEGTFRWRWLATMWANLHTERPMTTTALTPAKVRPLENTLAPS